MIKGGFLLAILVMLIASTAISAGPNLMSYQGQVLTAGGAPVANGSYPAVFSFYSVPAGGIQLWSESGSITTTAGLFTHNLGSITAIPAGLFANNSAVWLEVSVNGQIQSPRTQLTSVGYSQSVNTIDSATGGVIVGTLKVDAGSLELGTPLVSNSNMSLFGTISGFSLAAMYNYANLGGGFELRDDAAFLTNALWPDGDGTGGFSFVSNGFGGTAFSVDGNFGGSGWPYIYMSGLSSMSFDLSSAANNSVILPNDAIASNEILDEPGVASSNSLAFISPLTASMQDLTTVTITIPAPGYIWLTGKIREVDLLTPNALNLVWAQIDETAGGTFTSPHESMWGGSILPGADPMWSSIHCQRMYFKGSAGSYTFRLEAMLGAGSASAFYPTLTAIYFPTSYGSVATMVSSQEAAEFESATLAKANEDGTAKVTGATQTDMYKVDLRELELKVAKSRIETERLGRELAEARLKEQLNARPKPIDDKK